MVTERGCWLCRCGAIHSADRPGGWCEFVTIPLFTGVEAIKALPPKAPPAPAEEYNV
jgi:hypothetical protein